MSSPESPLAQTPARTAQTVAPVQASALQFAASILGEGGYTPTQQLNGTLSSPARGQETAPAVDAAPAVEPVRTVGSGRHAAPAPTRGWFGRLLDKLLGRS